VHGAGPGAFRAHGVSLRAVGVGLRGIDIFSAISVLSQFVVRLGLLGLGSNLRHFLRTETALQLLKIGQRRIHVRLQLAIIKRCKHLPGLNLVAFSHQHLLDATSDLGANPNIARFHGPGSDQGLRTG